MRIFGLILIIFSFLNIGNNPKASNTNYFEMTFPTNIDRIGIEVLNRINPLSIKNDWEFGGVIYSRLDGKIDATPPHTDKEPHRMMIPSLWKFRIKGRTLARYHTHGAESKGYDDESFSQVDTGNVNVDQYVITPSWNIIKFDSRTRRVYKYNPRLDIWTVVKPNPPKPEEEYFPPMPNLELYYKMPWLYNPNLINF